MRLETLLPRAALSLSPITLTPRLHNRQRGTREWCRGRAKKRRRKGQAEVLVPRKFDHRFGSTRASIVLSSARVSYQRSRGGCDGSKRFWRRTNTRQELRDYRRTAALVARDRRSGRGTVTMKALISLHYIMGGTGDWYSCCA